MYVYGFASRPYKSLLMEGIEFQDALRLALSWLYSTPRSNMNVNMPNLFNVVPFTEFNDNLRHTTNIVV